MSSDARLQLRRRLEEVLGGDAALILMDHLPEQDWSDVVRRPDLDRAVDTLGTQLRTEMAAMRHELTAVFRSELQAAVTTQTRTIIYANVGILGAAVAIAVTLSRLIAGAG